MIGASIDRLIEVFEHPDADALNEASFTEEVPNMTSLEERAFLFHFAKSDYRGEGALVDLGC